jgi:hypothetical protein
MAVSGQMPSGGVMTVTVGAAAGHEADVVNIHMKLASSVLP